MQYNFKGTYSSAQSYTVRDVVSYQPTVNDPVKYYFCISPNSNTSPQAPSNSNFWDVINALSNFPNSVDTFIFHNSIQGQDKTDLARINELTLKTTLSSTEQDELNSLIVKHRNKLFLADDLNAIQDSLSNMQLFFKDKIEAYINSSVASIAEATNSSLNLIDTKKNNIVSYMDSTTEGAIRRDIGDLSGLSTGDKSSLVMALNELKTSTTTATNLANAAKEIVLKGISNFTSNTGTIINHSIGNTNYYPIIIPTENPNGYLGEVWVEKANFSFKVLCSGSSTTTFDYVVLASSN